MFDNPVEPEELHAFLGDPGHLMELAVRKERLVGFASGTVLRHPDKAPQLFINEVGVATNQRRKGIATALVTRLIARSAEMGCASAWLATDAESDAASALYRSLGACETDGIVVYDWNATL